jgi:hypothetical protein
LYPRRHEILLHRSWRWRQKRFGKHKTISQIIAINILKPWPVRQSQSFYGGLGITIDDFLAAGYVNLMVWFISRFVQL